MQIAIYQIFKKLDNLSLDVYYSVKGASSEMGALLHFTELYTTTVGVWLKPFILFIYPSAKADGNELTRSRIKLNMGNKYAIQIHCRPF